MRTLYDLLDVRPDADDDALNKAYRQAAKAHHPDLNAGDPDAPRRFRQITTAIEILRDAKQRAAYDRFLDGERQRRQAAAFERQTAEREAALRERRSRRAGIVIADAIAAVALVVVLVGGYAHIGPTFSTSTAVSEGDNSAVPPVAMVGEPRAQRIEPAGGDERRRRHEQGLTVVAVSEQSAAVEREAALRREQEEHRQAAAFERQTAEREAALRSEQDERRQVAERGRQKAEREAALRPERTRPAVIALREEHKPRQSAALPEAARSTAPTPSQAVEGAQTASAAASPQTFGPAEIAAARAFTRF